MASTARLGYNTNVLAFVAAETTMPVLELTDEQVIALLQQSPDEQKKRVLTILTQEAPPRRRAVFGSGKNDIIYIAEDFDAPLEDFKDYM